MVGDYMGTLGDECFLPPNPFALDGGEGVGLRDTLDEKREKGFSFFSTEYPRVHEACVTGYSAKYHRFSTDWSCSLSCSISFPFSSSSLSFACSSCLNEAFSSVSEATSTLCCSI